MSSFNPAGRGARSLAAALLATLAGMAATVAGAAPVPMSLPRGTVDVRVERVTGPSGGATWLPTAAPAFVNIPKMSATFVAPEDETNLAIVFSAEAQTSDPSKRVFVRALVDGQVTAPKDVVFTEGAFSGARSFTFTAVVGQGVHTVEMQWLVDAGASASMRAASLLLRHGRATGSDGTLTLLTPESGASDRTTDNFWKPVPGMSLPFWVPAAGARTIVGFSAETHVTAGKRLFVRAKVDGVVASPTDVVFAQRASRQSHLMNFAAPVTLAAGWHTATIEWLVDVGGVGTLGDRTLSVSSFVQHSQLRHDLVVAPSGAAVSTSSSTWSTVPGLSALVPVPTNGEFAVTFSGEVSATTAASLEMRLLVAGVASNETAVMATAGLPFETQSFTFDRKRVALTGGGGLTGVELQWRAVNGTVFAGDRAMEIVAERGLVPDLAEAPEIGRGASGYPAGMPVEAAIGTRPVLTIIHRIPRVAPDNVIPTVAQVTTALYGAGGTAEYYDTVSGGRFGLTNAGVLEYDSLKSADHYWNHGNFNCGQAQQDGFTGGHAERWAESVMLADADVDFSAYDRDDDGVVSPNELAILIVVPQSSPAGFTRPLDALCSGLPVTVDGVAIPEISEWFTSSPTSNEEIATHELAHLLLNLGDMYVNNLNFDTEAGRLSLMGDNFGTTSHIDAANKLALGWLLPLYAPIDDDYTLDDVRSSSTVAVLPRETGGSGQEFFVLENRSPVLGDGLFDTGTGINGLLVWHVVEAPAQNATPPACMTAIEWAPLSSNARRGVRALRPGVDFASGGPSSWDAGDYDLLDTGLACPAAVPVRNALLWADGGASGYDLLGLSAPGVTMSFTIDRP